MPTLKNQIKLSIGYFLIAAILGLILRSFHSLEIPVNYKFIVHTHSHIALLGWVYLALTTLLYKLYLDESVLDSKYNKIFWFTQLSLVGMLLTFPFQGYALFSIIFSTLFLFASYWFTGFFLKYTPAVLKKTNSYKCIRAALWYLVLSSLGPWALGAIMNTLGPESVWYRLSIYFYLHFLYNGWMIMALVGLFLYVMEQHQIRLADSSFKRFFWSINLAILLTFSLSTLFAKPPLFFYFVGGSGALLQLVAFGILGKAILKSIKRWDTVFTTFQQLLLKTVVILLLVKIVLQLLTSLPYFADLAATILDFTIGYLHWTFLGVVTMAIFLFFDFFKILAIPKRTYLLYLLGFISTEVLIFYKGIAGWLNFTAFKGYFSSLAIASLLMVLALLFLLLNSHKPLKDK